mmetsp:Transcript_81776/g.249822  ORF Transcript_81776/g.249822 Transcript_81776/m.249822 type:complete len:226 (-) Transcript_81776:131-808(-)
MRLEPLLVPEDVWGIQDVGVQIHIAPQHHQATYLHEELAFLDRDLSRRRHGLGDAASLRDRPVDDDFKYAQADGLRQRVRVRQPLEWACRREDDLVLPDAIGSHFLGVLLGAILILVVIVALLLAADGKFHHLLVELILLQRPHGVVLEQSRQDLPFFGGKAPTDNSAEAKSEHVFTAKHLDLEDHALACAEDLDQLGVQKPAAEFAGASSGLGGRRRRRRGGGA